ncbi:uncharacterized protein EV420DRAFT_1728806 [Desarmillaria tabescens]|uniref:HNH nuclease domain-containing protein n=1 Tax=Armillaria tabescens TaxID=1929756 RepID=A0AA39TU78_ARMTA|nr:uncharacterized protein EV420DRAFT_1728806 [Desarmillaria tabescens]KAK0463649.1 hypothetical protein EV420DRAFT_1728806 [Desarmillaria tabescens]
MTELTADSQTPRPPLDPVIENGVECFGIPHWFVLDACLVVATSTPEPSGRIRIDENGFLTGQKYWFFLSDGAARLDYPVCLNFSEWTPLARTEVPERRLAIDQRDRPVMNPPYEASFSDISLALQYADGYSAISELNEELRGMHLVPEAYAPWYNHHRIFEYFSEDENDLNIALGPDARPIDDIRQILTLESGLKECMDRPSHVLAPFGDKYVSFFFAPWHIGLAENYHMRTARLPTRIQGYALFVRFAWAMIQLVRSFPSRETLIKKRGRGDYESADGSEQSTTSKSRKVGREHASDGVGPSSTGDSWTEASAEGLDTSSDISDCSDATLDDARFASNASLSNTHDDCERSELGSPSLILQSQPTPKC